MNPTVITIASFPFFFGVMFGDMGHGSILCAFAIYLCLNADKLKQSPVGKYLATVRYIFLLMGMMATYCGLVYNEFFALSLNLFGSCYDMNNPIILGEESKGPVDPNKNGYPGTDQKFLFKRVNSKCTYPFGLDPAYGAAENEL